METEGRYFRSDIDPQASSSWISLLVGIPMILISLWAVTQFCDAWVESQINLVQGSCPEASPACQLCWRWTEQLTWLGLVGFVSLLVGFLLDRYLLPLRDVGMGFLAVGRWIGLALLGTAIVTVGAYTYYWNELSRVPESADDAAAPAADAPATAAAPADPGGAAAPALAATSEAFEDTGETEFVATPIRIVERVEPDIIGRPDGIDVGAVVVEVEISAFGDVEDIQLVQGIEPGIDAAVLDAVAQYTFAPAEMDGEPVQGRLKFLAYTLAPEEDDGTP